MERTRRARPGQSLILLGVVGTVLMLMVGVVIDAGYGYVVRRQAQNAADSASRAGANFLAQGYTDAQINGVMSSVLINNYCYNSGSTTCSYTASYINTSGTVLGSVGGGSIPANSAGVKIIPVKTYPSYLASLLGVSTFEVTSSASAIYGTLGAASCSSMLPVATNGNTGTGFADWALGSCVLIKDDEGSPGGGSFGWVDFSGGGGGAAELAGWMNNYATSGNTGCTQVITVGTSSANIDTETGNMTSLQSAVLAIINSPNYNEVTVPIYDVYGDNDDCDDGGNSGSNLCYRTKGFGRFRVTDVKVGTNSVQPDPDTTECSQTLFGTNKGILGKFVGFVDPNGSISTSASGPAKVVNLLE